MRSHLLLLGLVLAFAAAVRAYGLSSLGFWTDELCSLSEADGHGLQLDAAPTDRVLPPMPTCTRLRDAGPASAIPAALARQDTHPPLYFLALRGWEHLFGDGEAGVRSLDVCFSVVAVGLLYAAAAPDVGPTAALWACLIMAVASPQVQFAQEARNYAPVLTFSLAAAVAQRHLARSPSVPAAVGLAACLLAMGLTHYYAATVAVALAAHAVLTVRGRPLGYTAAAYGSAAAAFAVAWGPAVVRQVPAFHASTVSWLTDASPGHRTRSAVALAKLPVRWVADVNDPWAALGGVSFLALPWAYRRRPSLRLWVLWAVVPMAVTAGGDLLHATTQLTLLRYTLFATPGAYVVLAGVLRRPAWPVAAVAVVAGLSALPSAYAPPWKADLRTPVEIVGRRLRPGDGLVVSGPDPVTAQVTLAAARHYLPAVPPTTVLLTRPADAAVRRQLAACPRVWVVWLWPEGRPVTTFVPGFVETDSGQLPHFGTVAVGRVVPSVDWPAATGTIFGPSR